MKAVVMLIAIIGLLGGCVVYPGQYRDGDGHRVERDRDHDRGGEHRRDRDERDHERDFAPDR